MGTLGTIVGKASIGTRLRYKDTEWIVEWDEEGGKYLRCTGPSLYSRDIHADLLDYISFDTVQVVQEQVEWGRIIYLIEGEDGYQLTQGNYTECDFNLCFGEGYRFQRFLTDVPEFPVVLVDKR